MHDLFWYTCIEDHAVLDYMHACMHVQYSNSLWVIHDWINTLRDCIYIYIYNYIEHDSGPVPACVWQVSVLGKVKPHMESPHLQPYIYLGIVCNIEFTASHAHVYLHCAPEEVYCMLMTFMVLAYSPLSTTVIINFLIKN